MSSFKDAATPSTASADRLTGRVKWFNNKAGYGFITVTDGSRSGSDIFVHHSSIGVASQQYKYLVQGEYVDFELSATPGGSHEFQATNVVGIKGGKLMCETRHEFKMARSSYKTTQDVQDDEPQTPRPVQKSAPKALAPRDSAPRVKSQEGEKKEWTFVSRKSATDKPVIKRQQTQSK
jgi:CspA family cold shock protein